MPSSVLQTLALAKESHAVFGVLLHSGCFALNNTVIDVRRKRVGYSLRHICCSHLVWVWLERQHAICLQCCFVGFLTSNERKTIIVRERLLRAAWAIMATMNHVIKLEG